MDENNEIANENVESQNTTPSDLSSQERRPKNKLKNAGKKVGQNIKNAFKQGMKKLWRALPLKVKLIIVAIAAIVLLLASAYIVYADYFVSSSEDSIAAYYSSEAMTSSKGASMYNSTGSLLFATNNDIKQIAETFFTEVKPVNNTLYGFMSKKYKNGDPENSGVPLKTSFWGDDALNINANKTLYEHLLNAERYNFNKIKWIKYLRDENKGMIPTSEMEVDTETELQYPSDSNGTTLDEFANKVRPYLQSWILPYGLFSGLLSEGTGENGLEYGQFAYQILINGYHEITMNQYNLQVETVRSTQNVYDILEYKVQRTIKKTKDGEGNIKTTVITKYVPNATTGANYTVKEPNCKQDAPVVDAPVYSTEIVYKLESAKMFDRIVNNTHLVHKYDKNTDTPEHYITREAYSDGEEKSQAQIDELSDFNFFSLAQQDSMATAETGTWTGTYTYTIKKGYTQNETKIWRDSIETISEEDRVLKTYDVEEYIADATLSDEEKKYYNDLAVEENVDSVRLTRVDIINAKKEIYSTYLKRDSNYSDNIGYPRSWLIFSYDTLKKHVKSIEESEAGWKFLYGASLGLEIKVNKPSSTNVSGSYSLIRDYNASGVLKAMQEVYAQYELKDYGGYTWDNVQWYPSNADYAWDNWKSTVDELAANYGVDPLWVLAKMSFESGGGRYSGYGTGAAAGPMQIQKSVHLNGTIEANNVKTGQKDKIVMTREALSDDKTNIQIGIMMYANHLKECNGNPYLAAQKYNYGNIGFVTTYAERTGKEKNAVINDLNDVGWVYDSMQYHLKQCSSTGARWGDGYYAYKFAIYLDYLKSK